MEATAIYANSWLSKSKKNAKMESENMTEFSLPRRSEYMASSRNVTKEDKAFLYNALKKVSS